MTTPGGRISVENKAREITKRVTEKTLVDCLDDLQRFAQHITLNGHLLMDLVVEKAKDITLTEKDADSKLDELTRKLYSSKQSFRDLLKEVLKVQLCSNFFPLETLGRYLHQNALLFCASNAIKECVLQNQEDFKYLVSGDLIDLEIAISKQDDDSIDIKETVKLQGLSDISGKLPITVVNEKGGPLMEVAGTIKLSRGKVKSCDLTVQSQSPLTDTLFGDSPQQDLAVAESKISFGKLIANFVDSVTSIAKLIWNSICTLTKARETRAGYTARVEDLNRDPKITNPFFAGLGVEEQSYDPEDADNPEGNMSSPGLGSLRFR